MENTEIHSVSLDSPIGKIIVEGTGEGVFSLRVSYKDIQCSPDKELLKLAGQMKRYFKGEEVEFTTRLDFSSLPPFTQRVLREVKEIPYGEVRTYKEIAQAIGNPKASRAVGQALKRNPVPILIPCHRVIRSNGKLGGFSLGREVKRYLLKLEGALSPRRR